MPIIVSVMGGHGMAHASAEAGTAKGAHASGTLITVPSEANVSLEEVAKATPGPKWFQIYLPSDRGKATDILQRAKAAGYLAIVLTIDNVGGGSRETEFRNRYRVSLPSGNYGDKPGQTGRSPQKRDLGWDDVAFIQKVTGLPVILKGVMSADLAVEAVQHGCGGIQVSNHGGRNLDDMPATITVLPRIAEAVAGRMPIVMDGGIRRGQDVFKALALGANAVAVGRPILYGLALGGWMGVQAVLDLLKAELDVTMHHVGVRSISEISRRYLV